MAPADTGRPTSRARLDAARLLAGADLDERGGHHYDADRQSGERFCLFTKKLQFVLCLCAGLVALHVVAWNHVARREWSLTCVQCGLRARCSSRPSADRPGAVPVDLEIETALSRWYSDKAGDAHEHRWLRGTCTRRERLRRLYRDRWQVLRETTAPRLISALRRHRLVGRIVPYPELD
jgi:hypothetical protein